MSKEKKTIVGAINITMQPHSPKKYASLLMKANKLRAPIQIRGDGYGILSGARKIKDSEEGNLEFTGDIFRFTNIDKNEHWFNLSKFDFANDEDLDRVRLPDELKPNSSRFTYILDANSHYIFYEGYFDGKSLSANGAQKFFERLFNHPELVEEFGTVEVTHIPKADALDAAINIPFKRRIEYTVTPPNPDDLEQAEQEVMRRMNQLNVREQHQIYKAVPGKSIEMDDDLELMARISAKNGNVIIQGVDNDDRPVEFATQKHPFIVTEYFNPAVDSAFSVVYRIAKEMKRKIDSWF